MDEQKDFLSEPELSMDEWTKGWTIHVGRAYACSKCGTMVMVTKGGIGTLEPKCCGSDMVLVKMPDEIR
ncbi:MAG: hypothetical protein A2073_03960 [Deltaproteobacteria bacterium GWC2_42_11]|nr:MAG: hypothetical protein A2073_03960 [Deltaproteobacteria bacterium GWC2_42_11]